MHRVVITGVTAAEAMQYRDQLLQASLIMHQDFEWSYHPPLWDGFTQERPKHTVFSFRDPALATFYQLKWS
jgi:hypothetical protein